MKNSLNKISSIILLSASVLAISACSELNDTSATVNNPANTTLDLTSTTNAVISTTNMQSLAITGTEAVKQAVGNNNAAFFLGAKINNPSPMQQFTVALAQQVASDPTSAIIPNVCDTGSIDLSVQNKTLTITNCTKLGITVNGTATITNTNKGDLVIDEYAFSNFTVVYAGNTNNVNLIVVCETNKTLNTLSCSYKSEAPGIDGRTYRASIASVSGDGTLGYTISARITDPDNGNIDVATNTPVTLNCPNNQPDQGSIDVSDGTQTMTVSFIDCASYSITYNGATTTYMW